MIMSKRSDFLDHIVPGGSLPQAVYQYLVHIAFITDKCFFLIWQSNNDTGHKNIFLIKSSRKEMGIDFATSSILLSHYSD